jgi:hypothetical protein
MAKFRFNHFIDIHWNGYNIVGDAGTIFSIPDQLYEEFEEDLRPVEPSLEWTDTNEFQTLTNSVAASTITGLAPIVATSTSTGKQISISSATAPDGYVLTADGAGGAAFEYSSGGGGGGVAVVGTSPISVLTASGTATVSLNANYSTSTHLHDADYVNVGGDTMSGQLLVSSATTTTTVGFGEVIVAKGTSFGSITVNAADDHLHLRSRNPIEVLGQSGPTMQGLRARGLGVNSSHTYPTLVDDGITFGEDANLYRVSANALKTDDALEVVGDLTKGGTAVSLSGHTHPYQAAGTYVTAVNGTAPITASTNTAGVVTVGLSASYASSIHAHATSDVTSGNFVATLAAGTGVTVTGADANAAAKTVAIGQAVATSSNVTFNNVTATGLISGSSSGHFDLVSTITLSRTVALSLATADGSAGTTLTYSTSSAIGGFLITQSSGVFTATVAGLYLINANIAIEGSTGAYRLFIYTGSTGGTKLVEYEHQPFVNTTRDYMALTYVHYFSASDTFRIVVSSTVASKTIPAAGPTKVSVTYLGNAA